MVSQEQKSNPSTLFAAWPRYRLSVVDYHRMGETGILSEDARVELINGELAEMPPIGSRHAGTVNRLSNLLTMAAQGKAVVATQNPVTLDDHSEPQPDIALLRPREDFYAASNPAPGDVLLLVEVAETSLEYDRNVKIPLYAQHEIPEVWLFDLRNGCLEVFQDPGPSGYQKILRPARPGEIAPSLLPTAVINVGSLLD
jgi:Uma2 family endonuclease